MHAEHATIHGEVTYREGDGMPIAIPEGPVELTHADDSVTVSWKEPDENAAGVAALPRHEYDRYVKEGKIVTGGGAGGGAGDGGGD
ncbi:hypothetical protein QRO11_09200 [Paracidovorax citrulli]|uniref:Uncharacterized protein n=2 Tax=Paracidovorax citrulli TaxID=80869 RepID=A1TPG3_PARC0|nr:hypothetical protein [Paracidovorax citrulli]ABM32851.1 hypothetical protein Aave_2273 [Paracidovorax citrulli AAC00-1]ATG93166.1 hypothetical protein CQB05_03205 [Paracidovorax citrulli]MVT28585.1 hypothetical protein [Paracidovorax citrulli]MVT36831.1 hypothetical protein [Paracidovorax citrulli]PVY67068.1 hypothetical protein C8E08_4497 [Paracidovorax citrulli]